MEKPALSDHRGERKLPPPPKVAPWLVFPHAHGKEYFGKFHTFYDISDPMKKSAYKFIPELSRKRFWQKSSHQGWVVILNYRPKDPNFNCGDCFLWNPISLETIMLPNIKPFHIPGPNNIVDGVLSAPPKSSSSGSDDNVGKESMVFFLFLVDEGSNFFIYCRPGDKEWRKHEIADQSVEPRSMFYLNGWLYIMGVGGILLEIAVQHGSDIHSDEKDTLKMSESIATRNNFRSLRVAGRLDNVCQSTVIESFGEVFKIDRFYIPRGVFKFLVNIEIGKLDFSSMAWEEVKSMDAYVFFLSDHNNLSCLASELGLPKGCVYFIEHGEVSLYKYDLEDKSVSHCLPCPDLPTPWSSPEWLMIGAKPRVDDFRRSRNHVSGKEAEKVITENTTRTSVDKLTTELYPWLVSVRYDQSVQSFTCPMHNNENYLMSIPEMLKGSIIRFSKDGWLLMSKDETLFFHNPFSRSIVTDSPPKIRSMLMLTLTLMVVEGKIAILRSTSGQKTSSLWILHVKEGKTSWRYWPEIEWKEEKVFTGIAAL